MKNSRIPIYSILYTIVFMCFTTYSMGQSCPCQLSVLHFTTQQQINNFTLNNPGCNKIYANVYIGSNDGSSPNTDIQNLAGLSQITRICGSLTIHHCTNLSSLSGLQGLTYLDGSLTINEIVSLADLTGLDNLDTIYGLFVINENPGLSSLVGLGSLKYIAADLYVDDNSSLLTLDGFGKRAGTSAMSVAGDIDIRNNPLLSECAVFATCEAVADSTTDITVQNNAPGCNSISEIQADCALVGIDDPETSGLVISSPLITDVLTIEAESYTSLSILDIAGHTIKQHVPVQPGINVVNLTQLTAGIYIITTPEGFNAKIIKN